MGFYEDMPYAFGPGALEQRLDPIGGGVHYQPELVQVSEQALQAKLSAIREYVSQFADHDALACSVREYAAGLGRSSSAERIWWP